jgi:carbamoyl-phosphate synthase large subunit
METLRHAKDHGLSDIQIGSLRGMTEQEVRDLRHSKEHEASVQDG